MSDERQAAAHREFQISLAAVHGAQASLAGLEARLRRLRVDRDVFGADTGELHSELLVERERLQRELEAAHAAARRAHTTLRRLTDPNAEPDDVDDNPAIDGYEQPSFAEPT